MPFVVESEATFRDGSGSIIRQGVARVYVATEERAKSIVADAPAIRTYRSVSLEEMPEKARAAMLAAHPTLA